MSASPQGSRRNAELASYVLATLVLSAMLIVEGRRHTELLGQVPLAAKELYAALSQGQSRLQIVDVREPEDFDDMHVPGAIPLVRCDDKSADPKAVERVLAAVPTVIVSADGAVSPECRARFSTVRVLAGGMTAWDDANLPEDSGEYVPPKNKAGGGCL